VIRVEGPVPLAQSSLWPRLREFYEQQGPRAFTSGTVPWRITSCPLLASAYADAAVAFAADAGGGPLQVVELGGGAGRMAFAMLRALEERGADARYLYTDGADSAVAAARAHPQLARWRDTGTLRFQRLDALAPGPLELEDGPVVIVANYLFDSLPHEAWLAEAGVARGQDVELWAPAPEAALEQAEARFVDASRAPGAQVRGYAAALKAGRFFWPIGAFTSVAAFAARLKRPHLWLVADKGPASRETVRGQDTALLARHGCVSAQVNFDAVRGWAGWRPYFEPAEAEVRFGAYGLVQGLREVPKLRAAWAAVGAPNLALQAVKLLDRIAIEPVPLMQLLQALAFTGFDPDAVLRLGDCFRDRLAEEADPAAVGALVPALDACWANHFALGEPNDLAFEIATTLHRAGQLSHAAGYYRRSIDGFGPDAATWFNLALCLLDLGRRSEAREALQQTVEVDPAHARARALLQATG
jgi:hypothetical protein